MEPDDSKILVLEVKCENWKRDRLQHTLVDLTEEDNTREFGLWVVGD